MSEWNKVRLEQWGVAVMGILAYVLALYAEGVYRLVKDASAFGGAGIFVVFMVGMFTKFGSATSAVVSLAVGASVWLVARCGFDFEFSYLLGLVTAFGSYVVVVLNPGSDRREPLVALGASDPSCKDAS